MRNKTENQRDESLLLQTVEIVGSILNQIYICLPVSSWCLDIGKDQTTVIPTQTHFSKVYFFMVNFFSVSKPPN